MSSARDTVEGNTPQAMEALVFLDARWVLKTESQVLLTSSVSPRELMDRQMPHIPHVFVPRKSSAQTTSC